MKRFGEGVDKQIQSEIPYLQSQQREQVLLPPETINWDFLRKNKVGNFVADVVGDPIEIQDIKEKMSRGENLTDSERDYARDYSNMGIMGLALDTATGKIVRAGTKALSKVKEPIIRTTADAGQAILKKMGKVERLSHLMNYPKKLASLGFDRKTIDKISSAEASVIIKNSVSPEKFSKSISKNIPLNDYMSKFDDAIKTWIGSRDASKVEAIIKSEQFEELGVMGTKGFDLIQSGKFKSSFEDVRKYFDGARQELLDNGVNVGYMEDYLPGLWKNTPEEVSSVMGRKLSSGTPFSASKLFETYAEGISAGLTPKYSTVQDLVGTYEVGVKKLVADKKFFSFLEDNKLISKASEAPRDWISLNPDKFPLAGDEVYRTYPEMAKHINNYLSQPTGIMQNQADFNKIVKSIALSAGIPTKLPGINTRGYGSGFNTLGLWTVTKSTLSNPNPVKGFARAMEYLINPQKATQYVSDNFKRLPDFIKHGGVVSVEDYNFLEPITKLAIKDIGADDKIFKRGYKYASNLFKKGINKTADFNAEYFEKNIFESILPAIKLQSYDQIVDDLAQHLPLTQAKRESAKTVNSIFGGNNYNMLLRNKETQNFWRTILLAPDSLESSGRIAQGMAKALLNPRDPRGRAYLTFARNYLLHRASTEVTNYVATGGLTGDPDAHFQYENEGIANKIGMIETNLYQKDGTNIVFKIPNIDPVRLPTEFALKVATGDIKGAFRLAQHRMAPGIAMGLQQLTNEDYRGKPISDPEDTSGKQLLDRTMAGVTSMAPSYVKGPVNLALGKQGGLETLAQMTEAPVRFYDPAYNKTDKETRDVMIQGGASGRDIHKTIDASKPWNQPDKLTTEQQQRNLDEGLNINTQRNLLGKPKDNLPQATESSLSLVNTNNVSSITELRNRANESQASTEKNALIKQIFSSLESDEQVSKALESNGITMREGISYMAKNLGVENGQRGEYLMSILETTKDKKEFESTALEMAKSGLLTSGVTAQWKNSNTITDTQKKQLDNIIKASKGQSISSSSGRSSQAKGSTSVKYNLPTKKFASKLPGLPKLKELQSSSDSRIVAPRLTVQSQAKPKMEKLEKYN